MTSFASQAGIAVPAYRIHEDGHREDFNTTVVLPAGAELPDAGTALRIPCLDASCCPQETL